MLRSGFSSQSGGGRDVGETPSETEVLDDGVEADEAETVEEAELELLATSCVVPWSGRVELSVANRRFQLDLEWGDER